MIEVVPLAPEHLAAFEPEKSMRGVIPENQYGQAAVFVEDGKPLAICFVWDKSGVAEVGVVLAAAARKYPVTIHRSAREMLAGLHMSGYRVIRTWPEDRRSERWLRRLGFQPVEGAFEKWIQ